MKMNSTVALETWCPLSRCKWGAGFLFVVLACCLGPAVAIGQNAESEGDAASALETPSVDGAASGAEEVTKPVESPVSEEKTGESSAESADASSSDGWLMLAIVVALLVVPMFLGGRLSERLKMPDHGWKFSVVMGSLAAAAVVVGLGEIKLGPDLSGGITLIYELQDTSAQLTEEGEEETPEQSNFAKKHLIAHRRFA